MQTLLHTADSRGHASHGWLNSYHTFSFAGYNNAQRVHFGALRVLNDDTVAGGMGFGTHPHDNMEIISIPLSGTLEHKDSAGNHGIIQSGDVQVMSAGTGIAHSEKNHSKTDEVQFLQIWLFPNKRNVPSRYDQQTFRAEDRHNQFQQVLSPNPDDAGVWIHQDAWFHLADFDADFSADYQVKRPGNGVYVFVLEGDATVAGQALHRRDGFGVWATDSFTIKADSNTRLLLMDVPMSV
ncbi:pirin family protein [Hymenobacter tibetensis]|uniref:Pirin family protein n=1 Tax=Hymenobacter tibetensis TaxID=497967 RepID=A0ABY4CZH7_9BACT|nr:pirin family protein [Hymenobacter tibetensis]UOG75678.1 pirin family protein [Hymenobacter tibetensis]